VSGGIASIAWVDGALVPREEARVSIDDFGFRYGLTCFETMLARNGNIFRLDEHLARLEGSLRLFRADPPPRAALKRAVAATLEANALTEASVRLSVSAGVGGPPALPARRPGSTVVTVEPVAPRPPRSRLWVSSVRLDAQRPWRAAKVGQYAPYLLARREAEDLGFEDALLLDHAGYIVETATSNVFALVDGTLVTPPEERGPIPGITRACLLELAPTIGVPVRPADLVLADLARAVALFATNSVVGLEPINQVEWDDAGQRHRWDAPALAETFRSLSDAYESLVDEGTR
jgi:branched-subunit amino acid aminotransferase/4-amino-4-deoxychorismate lyase